MDHPQRVICAAILSAPLGDGSRVGNHAQDIIIIILRKELWGGPMLAG